MLGVAAAALVGAGTGLAAALVVFSALGCLLIGQRGWAPGEAEALGWWTLLSLLALAAAAQVGRWRRAEQVLQAGAERRRRLVCLDPRRSSSRRPFRHQSAARPRLHVMEG
jgi:hypothetical protein